MKLASRIALGLAIFGFGFATHTTTARAGEAKDIVEIAAANKNFSTLVAAVKAAGLVETLKSEGPFTVFAPTDKAFSKLPKGTLEKLLNEPGKKTLKQILLYHVVKGKVMSGQAAKLEKANTAQGQAVKISTEGNKVCINGATVVMPDIQASNGVIHVIDTVILPPKD